MQNFVETVKVIGNVIEGQVIDIQYLKTPEAQAVQKLTPDCGACTQLYDYPDKVMVRYFVEPIADQVKQAGHASQMLERGATVEYVGGGSDRLYFSGTILPNQ